ncbi:MAG: hypothetical protein ACXACF_07500 [Candidatus Hermodarchaeia archaeon]|jgi:hypothetical protein
MTKKPEKGEFGDLVVVATFEEIKEGAQRIIGSRMKVIEGKEGVRIFVIEGKEGVRIFSDETTTCPLQVTATPLQKGVYRLDVGSKCTIKNCDYFAECARLDARAAKSLEFVMAEILGEEERIYEGRRWRPERIRENEKLQRIIDRIIDEGM